MIRGCRLFILSPSYRQTLTRLLCVQRPNVGSLISRPSLILRLDMKSKSAPPAEFRPTPETLYDQAFAELALGDYTASLFSSRRAANLALELFQTQPVDQPFHREAALNALLLLHEAAKAAHDIPAAIYALEKAGALVDKKPLLCFGRNSRTACTVLA